MTIAAMKQALEALESFAAEPPGKRVLHPEAIVITALRAAIEQAEKAEPVHYQYRYTEGVSNKLRSGEPPLEIIPLYTHPAPVPAGWQLVPVAYTYAMRQAFLEGNTFDERYAMMLQAALKKKS